MVAKGSEQILSRKIDILIGVCLKAIPRDRKSLTLREQIDVLDDLGVGPAEIARIIGRTANYVNKELSAIRKTGKRKENAE